MEVEVSHRLGRGQVWWKVCVGCEVAELYVPLDKVGMLEDMVGKGKVEEFDM